MKKLICLTTFLLFFGCSDNKYVYWCGDHACFNKKEREAYFKKTMIIEMKKSRKQNASQRKDLSEKARLDEKRRIKEEKELIKQARLDEKRRIKEEKELIKQARLDEKRRIKEEKELIKQASSKSKRIKKENSLIEEEIIEDKILIVDREEATLLKESISEFDNLVEIITKRNISKPYPDINDIPN